MTAGGDAIAILQIGSVWTQGHAAYTSGNGTDTLVFEYTVIEEDSDTNGVNAFMPHGQDIKATGTDVAYQPNPGGVTPQMGEDFNHKVDGSLVTADTTSPTVSSVSITSDPGDDNTYAAGDAIQVTVTFSKDITVTGTPQLEIDVGGTAKTASYSSTDGAEVVFSYTVASGDADGIAIGENKIELDDGTIEAAARTQPRGISPVGSTQRTTASGDSKAQYRVVLSAFVVSKSHAGALCLPTLLQSERF